MFRYGEWLEWEPEAGKVYRAGEEGVGPGEPSICADSRSPFFGTKPLGGQSKIDHRLGDLTGETKQPDSSRCINSGKNGRIFAHRLQKELADATVYIQNVILEGAKQKKGLIITSPVLGRKLFRDFNRELQKWGKNQELLSEKFESGEITPDEVCYVNQLARDLMTWRGTNRHIADEIFREPIHRLVAEYDGIRKFYDEMVDPLKVFVSDVMNFVSPIGWVSIQRKDYKKVLDFKRVTGARLKFQVKNVPEILFTTQIRPKKTKRLDLVIYQDGDVERASTSEGDLPQESSPNAGATE